MTSLTSPMSSRVRSFGQTVFATFTKLAQDYQAINLGQGFPDFHPPAFVQDALRESASGPQQYAPLYGVPQLLRAVANKMTPRLKREIVPSESVLITVGVTEALFAISQALIEPGDEVVLLEPFFDAYPADVIMAGGIPRYVPLLPQSDGTWMLDTDELAYVFNDRTKLIFLNTPHNPTGKIFLPEELDTIINLAHKHNAYILADEVYEHIAFAPHVHVATRPGAWERTLTTSSVGKTFSATGWKIGWIVAPETLVKTVCKAHQWIPFVVATPLQQASAVIINQSEESGYYEELAQIYKRKLDLLVNGLHNTPFKPLPVEGSYFVMAESSALGYEDDVSLCLELPERAGIVAIPPSAFYCDEHKDLAKHYVRFAFCKTDEALIEAGERLKQL